MAPQPGVVQRCRSRASTAARTEGGMVARFGPPGSSTRASSASAVDLRRRKWLLAAAGDDRGGLAIGTLVDDDLDAGAARARRSARFHQRFESRQHQVHAVRPGRHQPQLVRLLDQRLEAGELDGGRAQADGRRRCGRGNSPAPPAPAAPPARPAAASAPASPPAPVRDDPSSSPSPPTRPASPRSPPAPPAAPWSSRSRPRRPPRARPASGRGRPPGA